MSSIKIEGLRELQRSLRRLPQEVEREMDREFGPARWEDGERTHLIKARSQSEVERRAKRAVDRAIRKSGL